MNPIEPSWEEVELKDGYFLWFDGDTIKKVISFRDDWRFEYIEQDNEINTRDRQFVLPLPITVLQNGKRREKTITLLTI